MSSVTRPPSSGYSRPSGVVNGRLKWPFTKRTSGSHIERTEHAGGEVRREVRRVRVEVEHQLAARDRERAPHGVALAQHRAELGEQLRLLVHLGAARGGDLGAPVAGGGVDHQDLVDQRLEPPQALHDRADRVRHLARREHDRDGLPLLFEQPLQGELRMVEGPDQLPRTIAVREPCSDHLPLGSRARAGARRGARGQLARARAGRARGADPGRSPPGPARGARRRRDRGALGAPGRRARGGPPRPRDRDHGHRQRQVARLQPAGARHAGERRRRARLLPLPDEGARAGPGARARAHRREVPAPRDLRRRHPARGAPRDPAALEPDPHEPGHAARGRAAEPPLVGRRAREPRLGRGGRGARVPRRVRLPRGERAAAAAPARPRLRQRAALPAHQRDDRQPARAGRAAHRASRSSSWTATARRAPSARSRCGTRRSWTSASAGAPPRCPRRPTCSPSWWSARSARSAS